MSDEPKYRDEEWLREQYVEERRSTTDIADECGCDPTTVNAWLGKHGIEARSRAGAVEQYVPDQRLMDSDWLREEYVEQQRSTTEIAADCGCDSSTVAKWLSRHGIESREGKPRLSDSRLADAEWLREQYVHNGQQLSDIAIECDCSPPTVSRWLSAHGIDTRKRGLSGREHPNYNGGAIPYGPGWNKRKREIVRDRDDYICQDPRCDVTQADHLDKYGRALHVHHLQKARDIGDPEKRNAAENLITLCRDCHRRWEKIADAGLVPQGVTDR